ncbi:hypothetical protein CsatB_002362 [Cannabis sativa]
MEPQNSLYGTLVKDMNTLSLPYPLSTIIRTHSTQFPEILYISDIIFGDTNVRRVRPVISNHNGLVKLQGREWNTFVRDRGVRVGDILLFKLIFQIAPIINDMIINVTLIRLNPQNYLTFTPLLPYYHQEQFRFHHRNWQQQQQEPILCVKRLSFGDVCGTLDHDHKIVVPKEMSQMIMASELDLLDLRNGNFWVVLRDQTLANIKILMSLVLSDDNKVLFGSYNWWGFVYHRNLKAEDVVVFCFDLHQRIIFTTVYRSHQFLDCIIPLPPGTQIIYVCEEQ